jgi:anhydro-N-acetylmuramic acid kinase
LPSDIQEVVVCGGGAFNTQLMSALQRALPRAFVLPSDARGLPAMDVEAAAFAWLAEQTLLGLPGNVVEVTGAAGPRVLGAVYPA